MIFALRLYTLNPSDDGRIALFFLQAPAAQYMKLSKLRYLKIEKRWFKADLQSPSNTVRTACNVLSIFLRLTCFLIIKSCTQYIYIIYIYNSTIECCFK